MAGADCQKMNKMSNDISDYRFLFFDITLVLKFCTVLTGFFFRHKIRSSNMHQNFMSKNFGANTILLILMKEESNGM